jgi:cation:H+ antiporter
MIDDLYALVREFPFVALVLGFAALIWSADRFVNASAAAAKNMGVSKIIIGLTFVAVGTSAPEIMVGIRACLAGSGQMAIGNAIGSNIANIGLVLGVTALVRPLPFSTSTLKREIPWLLGATALALICVFNLYLGRIDGLILLAGLGFLLYRLSRAGQGQGGEGLANIQSELDELPDMGNLVAAAWFFAGLAVLLFSADVLVEAASEVALRFGVSEMVIGLTVVAIGTSLPELSVTITAVLRGHADMAIGNVVGSNILNILAVLAIPALMAPQAIDVSVLWRDYGMMLALTAALTLFAYAVGSRKVITRFEGAVLCAAYAGFTYIVYHHHELPAA